MCNLYSITRSQEAMRRFFAVGRDLTGNLLPMPCVSVSTFALLAFCASAQADPLSCANSPSRIGSCFTVHGRLTSCTAVPSLRIWIIGTRRMLGIEDPKRQPGGNPLLPDKLERLMLSGTPCTKAAFGDFTVCPLTPDIPGVMRRVCVARAKKIFVQ